MPRKLKDIEIAEVSLVDAAANRKKFAIVKGAQPMFDILKKFLGPDATLTEGEIAKVNAMPAEAAADITKAIDLLDKYKADLPDDVLAAVKTLAKAAATSGDIAKADDADTPLDVEKVGAKFSKATLEQLTKLKEIIDGLVAAAKPEPDPANKAADRYAGLPAEHAERLRALDAAEAAERDKVAKAATDAATARETALTEAITALTKRIESLEKVKGPSTVVKGQGDPAAANDKLLWPSLG